MKFTITKTISILALGIAILHSLRLPAVAQSASVPQATAVPVICTWKNDAKAALSFTFDDGTVDHFTQAAPMLEKNGLRGTFFIVINWIGKGNKLTWEQVKSLSERGHEIGNHSLRHWNLASTAEKGDLINLEKEIVDPIGIIREKIGVAPVTFAYPLNARNPQVQAMVEQHHIASRLISKGYNGTKFNLETANRDVDSLIAKGGNWVVMIHGIDPALKGYLPFADATLLDQHFAYVKSREKELWVDTFANVTRYQLTAAACEVKSLQNTLALMEFELIGKESNKPEKNAPLTLRIGRTNAIDARQGDRKLELRSQGNATLCCEVVPNAGPVQVSFAPCGSGFGPLAPQTDAQPVASGSLNATKSNDELLDGFQSPPPSARPELFWDWMHDLVTKEGITHNLEAMKRNGFSGAMIMLCGDVDAGFNPTHNMPNPIKCMSPEFFEHWKFAAEEANRLGLTLISQCGPGWCHSGGPWITPEQAVQHLDFSEVSVTGPLAKSKFILQQSTSTPSSLGYHAALTGHDETKWVQVDLGQAYPIERVVLNPLDHDGQKGFGFPVRFKVEGASDPSFAAPALLLDRTTENVPNPGTEAVIVDGQGRTVRYVRITATQLWKRPTAGPGPYCFGLNQLQVFAGGRNVALNGKVSSKDSVEEWGWSARGLVDGRIATERRGPQGELILTPPGGRDFTHDVAIVALPKGKKELQPGEIVELTSHIQGDVLTWDVPQGEWTLRRYGMKNAKAYNRVAPAAGRGLECDKLSREANQAMFDGMVGRFIKDSPKLAGKTILGVEADSWEVGHPEWSANFRKEFQARRGYDPVPWLVGYKGGPKFAAKDLSARFEYDLLLTQTDLFADNFFSYLNDVCAKKGMEFMTEGYYGPFDPVRCDGRTARPMGEVWASGDCIETLRWAASAATTYGRKMVGAETFTGRWSDGAWSIDPYAIKRIGDLSFCHGLNKMTMHGTALEPWGDKVKPGMGLGFWGTMFNPGQTWWNQGRAWVDYISRCQFMLQQGHAVADILYVFPSLNWRNTVPSGLHKLHNDDFCSEETFLQAEFKDGRFVLPHSDAGYRVLVLPRTSAGVSPALLRKALALVKAGGTVVCSDRPTRAAGLQDYPASDREVEALAAELWGACDGKTVKENRCGQGRLCWIPMGKDQSDPETNWVMKNRPAPQFYGNSPKTMEWSPELRGVLRDLQVASDVETRTVGGPAQLWGGLENTLCGSRSNEAAVAWIHRREGDREIYFVSSQVATPMSAEMTFRVSDKIPEIWNAETGTITPAAVWRREAGRTVMPLNFTPFGSMFVVFRSGKADAVHSITRDGQAAPAELVWRRGKVVGIETDQAGTYELKFASGRTAKAEVRDVPTPLVFNGPWQVKFPAGWGAPAEAQMEAGSWTTNADAGIRYFSGTATYGRDFEITKELLDSKRSHTLDLGQVKNLAEVMINGQSAGILWKPPFRVDVTRLLKPGRNQLEIKVTNLWVNRMVGDEQQPDDCEWMAPRRQCNDPAGQGIKHIPDWVWTGAPRPQTNRYTFTTWKFYNRDTPLLDSGLLGPVTLQTTVSIRTPSHSR
jgi:peptidoglycan/xylan/chitin deacetylase (PgdA/CDA1 family)